MTNVILTGQEAKLETVEQTGRKNWIANLLQKRGYPHFGFEGATIKGTRVSAFLERLAFSGPLRSSSRVEILRTFQSLSGPLYKYKWMFLERLSRMGVDIPWFLIVYTFNEVSDEVAPIYILDVKNDTEIRGFSGESALQDFAKWLQRLRSMRMTSLFQEEGHLSPLDKQLRRMGMPWPGNIDGILYSGESGSWALIEFQYTRAVPVKKHCNNVFFAPRGRRKGDAQRWMASKMIADSLNLPLIIIVWNEDPKQGLKLKKVAHVNSLSISNPGLQYSYKEYYPHDELDRFFLDLSSLV